MSTCIYCGYKFIYRPQKAPLCNSQLHCSTECVLLGNRCHMPTVAANLQNRMFERDMTPKELAEKVGTVENPRTGKTVTSDAAWIRRRLNGTVIWNVGELGLMCVAADTTLQAMSWIAPGV